VTTEDLQKVLQLLWDKSRIPLTEDNLLEYTELSSRKLKGLLNKLCKSGAIVQTEAGYEMPGRTRAIDGPETIEHFRRRQALIEKARQKALARRGGQTAPEPAEKAADTSARKKAAAESGENESSLGATMGKAALFAGGKALVALDKPLALLDKPAGKGQKSLLWSGGLSLLGPLGWLYAGSFREAIPALLLFAAIGYLVPSFLLMPLMWVAIPASALVGLTYAWQYNRKGGRTPLLLKSKRDKKSDDSSDQ
jgi:hypothetical protein